MQALGQQFSAGAIVKLQFHKKQTSGVCFARTRFDRAQTQRLNGLNRRDVPLFRAST